MSRASRFGLVALVGVAALTSAHAQTPAQTPPPAQGPIFRSGAYYVSVDAYPRKDGKIVDGLKAEDFDVFEDGKLQKVESLKFFRVDARTPDAVVRDPNTVGESLARAADPANRVFVVYLDKYHVTIGGAHDARKPLIDMLDRVLAPNDLFALMMVGMRPRDLAFGRKMQTTEDELARYWPWGERDSIRRSPEEDLLNGCFGYDQRGQKVYIEDEGVRRWVSDMLRERRNEDATLTNVEDLVTFLGQIKEERKSVVLFSGGWRLFGPAPQLEALPVSAGANPVVQNGGTLGMLNGLRGGTQAACNSEVIRLAILDDRIRMQELTRRANQANVTFYPVNPEGLVAFDTAINDAPVLTGADPSVNTLAWEVNRTRARADALRTMAEATDGIAVVTNDLVKGLQRVTDDLSAYYVLGYYSSNTKFDGKFRKIEVKLKPQGTKVVARRGYTAPTPGEVSARAAAAATKDVMAVPEGFDEAMNVLGHLRPNAEVFGYGVVMSGAERELAFVTELSNSQLDSGRWAGGAKVRLAVTTAAGDPIGGGDGLIDAGRRAVALRVPLGKSTGAWRVRVSLTPVSGDPISDSFTVQPAPPALLGEPLLSRSGLGERPIVQPVASFLFRRTERLHVEWPESSPLDQRQARLLDRAGKAIPIDVVLSDRASADGRGVLVAEVSLSPLAPGDYLIELTASSGATSVKKLIAIRVGA